MTTPRSNGSDGSCDDAAHVNSTDPPGTAADDNRIEKSVEVSPTPAPTSKSQDEDEEFGWRRRPIRTGSKKSKSKKKKTIPIRDITQFELKSARADLHAMGADVTYVRPKIRGDCMWCSTCQEARDDPSLIESLGADSLLRCGHSASEVICRSRPCVFVACKYTLYLDMSDTGSIVLNFPHLEPEEMPSDESCSLDVADQGGLSLEDIAELTNRTRERVRQIETKALVELKPLAQRDTGLDIERKK